MIALKEPLTGVQLYTLRRFTKTPEDFDDTLRRLAQMGVREVQISAIGDISPEAQRESLARHGMRVCVTHQNFDRIQNELPALIALHKTIGCDALGLGYAPDAQRTDLPTARAFIRQLETTAQTLRAHGIGFHYHNHAFEFAPLPGSDRSLMDLLLEETDPALISLIPDVAWIHFAGHDPAAFLARVASRVKVVHFKDYVPDTPDAPRFVSLGQGVVDLPACFAVCREKEIPYVMYEQDSGWTNDDPFRATAESLAYFDRLHAG